jgi:hypothetical protein
VFPRVAAAIGALIVLLVLLAGCTSSGGASSSGGGQLLEYQRVWPDGMTERTIVFDDGRVQMQHGDVLERLTLSAPDLDRLRAALAQPIPTGSPEDSPRRTLTLANGTVIQSPRPDGDNLTALLDNLTSTHRLDG